MSEISQDFVDDLLQALDALGVLANPDQVPPPDVLQLFDLGALRELSAFINAAVDLNLAAAAVSKAWHGYYSDGPSIIAHQRVRNAIEELEKLTLPVSGGRTVEETRADWS
jgi:hypothetical protein